MRIASLPASGLRERLTRYAALGAGEGGRHRARPSAGVVRPGVARRGEWPTIRPLEGLVESPIVRADGSILSAPGYDPATGLFLHWPGDPVPLRDRPTRDDAVRAAASLLDAVADFPFAGPAYRAAWLAALLTPLARHAMPGPVPLFLVDANVRGAGKGLLVNVIGAVVAGREMAVATYTADLEEMRKRITAILLGGDALVLFDNVAGPFGNAILDAALTANVWKDRVLGASLDVNLPLGVSWYATGNNVTPAGDIMRRLCPIRLDSPHERPEERRTDVRRADLIGWVKAERPRLLADALTILSAYCTAGRPNQGFRPWGSFEAWSGLVRSAVVWCGLSDPAEGRVEMQSRDDDDLGTLRTLVAAVRRLDPDGRGVTSSEIIDRLFGPDPLPELEGVRASVRAVLRSPDANTLGYRLRSFARRPCDGMFIDKDGNTGGVVRWRAFPVAKLRPHATTGARGDRGDRWDLLSDAERDQLLPD